MKGKCQSLLSLQRNKMSTTVESQRPKTARQPSEESSQRPLSAKYLGSSVSEETNQRPKTARCLGIRSKLNPVVAQHKESLVILRCNIIFTDIIQFSFNQGEQTGRLWRKAPGSDQGRQDERVSQEDGQVGPLTNFTRISWQFLEQELCVPHRFLLPSIMIPLLPFLCWFVFFQKSCPHIHQQTRIEGRQRWSRQGWLRWTRHLGQGWLSILVVLDCPWCVTLLAIRPGWRPGLCQGLTWGLMILMPC